MSAAGVPTNAADCLAEQMTCTIEQYRRAKLSRPLTETMAGVGAPPREVGEDPYTGASVGEQ